MTNETRHFHPAPIRVLAATCLGISAIVAACLAWQALDDSLIPGCGPGSGCKMLMHSRWSKMVGIPVSAPATAIYLLLAISALMRHPLSQRLRLLQTSGFVLVLGAAVWFAVVQGFLAKAFCPWCSLVHLVAGLAALMLWTSRAPCDKACKSHPLSILIYVIPVGALAVMAWLQSSGSEPERYAQTSLGSSGPKQETGLIRLHNGLIELDPSGLPRIGNPAAAVTALALTDFSCPQCRALHHTLQAACSQRPDRFNVILLPGYHDDVAEKLHRIMLSLWRIDPVLFREISEGIANGTVEANAEAAVAAVQSALGGRFFELAFRETRWVDETLRLGKRLLAANELETGTSTLPHLMIGDRFLAGNPGVETILAVADGAAAPALPTPRQNAPSRPVTSPPPPLAAAAPHPTPGARISFAETTLDLGTVIKGKTASGTFKFSNPGSQPLEITDLRASCGCTTVEGYRQTVPPGGEGSFEVILDTKDLTGMVHKAILITTNTSPMPVHLGVKADVWAPVKLSAPGISFGSILKGGKAPPREIEIAVRDGESVRIGEHQCDNPYFQTEWLTLEKDRRYQLKVSIPKLGDKVQQGKVIIPLGNHLVPQVEIPLHVNPVDLLTIYPTAVMLPPRKLQTPTKGVLSLQCHDEKLAQFELKNVRVSGSQQVAVTLRSLAAIKRAMIELTFPTDFDPALAVREQALLQLETNHPDYREIQIPMIRPGGPAAGANH